MTHRTWSANKSSLGMIAAGVRRMTQASRQPVHLYVREGTVVARAAFLPDDAYVCRIEVGSDHDEITWAIASSIGWSV